MIKYDPILGKLRTKDTSADFNLNRTSVHDQDYDVLETDTLVAVTENTDDLFFTLPPIATIAVGKVYIFKVEYSNLLGKSIYIRPAGSEKIDGATEVLLSTAYASVSIYSNGSNWFTF